MITVLKYQRYLGSGRKRGRRRGLPFSNPRPISLIFQDSNHVFYIRTLMVNHFLLVRLSRGLNWAFLIEICLFSVVVVVKYWHFCFHLQNHWANFNPTWHKASFVEGDSDLFKRKTIPFIQEEIITKKENIHLPNLKSSQNHWANFI